MSSDDSDMNRGHHSDSSAGSPTPKKSKRPGRSAATKTSIIESASDGSDSDIVPRPPVARPSGSSKGAKHGPTKRKPKRSSSSSESDRKASDSDDLYEDEDDRRRLELMSEKDREVEIFNRMERKEMEKTRLEIEKKLKKAGETPVVESPKKKKPKIKEPKKPKKAVPSDNEDSRQEAKAQNSDSDFDAEFQRPSEFQKKQRHRSAMADLLKQRREKEEKKKALQVDKIFGDDERRGRSGSSSSSSSRSSSSDSLSSESSNERGRRASGEQSAIEKKIPVDTLNELLPARLSRFRLSKIVHAPFFAKTVIGCFVRIGTGMIQGRSMYKIGQIIDVVETAKVYNCEGTRTNKGLRLRHGREERVYRLEFVSNSPITEEEFIDWKHACREIGQFFTSDQIEKKRVDIEAAMRHNHTNQEVDATIKEKARFNQTPRNFAVAKSELMKKKDAAEQRGDLHGASQIQREIEDLDRTADQLDKQRAGESVTGLAFLNRSRRNKMTETLLSKEAHADSKLEDDPFTRKSGRLTAAKAKTALEATNVKTEKPAGPDDLFTMHSVKLDLDIDLGILGSRPSAPAASTASSANADSSSNFAVPGNSRALSIEDYRRRKAMKTEQT